MPENVGCQKFYFISLSSSLCHTVSAIFFLVSISTLYKTYIPQQEWLLKFQILSPICTSERTQREGAVLKAGAVGEDNREGLPSIL